MEENVPLSIQSMLIRQMQIKEGQIACFATASSMDCQNKECCWRHDCFDEMVDMRLQKVPA